jgi:hypothetical protein
MKRRSELVALPRWLAKSAVGSASVRMRAMHAVTSLIEVAVIAGGASRTGRWRCSDLDGLRERLGGMYERLQIPDRAITGSAADYDACVEGAVGGAIDPWVRSLHRLTNIAALARVSGLGCWAVDQCADPRIARRPPPSRQGLATSLRKVRVAYADAARWRVDGPKAWSCADQSEGSPFDVLRMCVATLHRNGPERALSSLDIDALLLLGDSLRCIAHIRQCELCFRWAIPGHSTCFRHSLSAEAGGNRLDRQARYEKGKALLKMAGVNPLDEERRMFRTREEMLRTVSQIIWPGSGLTERQGMQIAGRLSGCPHIVSAIEEADGALRGNSLPELLRRVIDPLEYRAGAWRNKLRAAEAWICLEQMPARQVAAWNHSIAAIEMLPRRTADVQCKQVASAVGQSPSAFSHFLTRRQDVAMVRSLACVLRARRSQSRDLSRLTRKDASAS